MLQSLQVNIVISDNLFLTDTFVILLNTFVILKMIM